jgi:hypothetical protein
MTREITILDRKILLETLIQACPSSRDCEKMIQDNVHFRSDRRSTSLVSPTTETMIPFSRSLKITRTGSWRRS